MLLPGVPAHREWTIGAQTCWSGSMADAPFHTSWGPQSSPQGSLWHEQPHLIPSACRTHTTITLCHTISKAGERCSGIHSTSWEGKAGRERGCDLGRKEIQLMDNGYSFCKLQSTTHTQIMMSTYNDPLWFASCFFSIDSFLDCFPSQHP